MKLVFIFDMAGIASKNRQVTMNSRYFALNTSTNVSAQDGAMGRMTASWSFPSMSITALPGAEDSATAE